MVGKDRILVEIRRIAEESGGLPPGRITFLRETGIKETDWLGKFWSRWGDAVQEAGFQPNKLQEAYTDARLFTKMIELTRELGRLPVKAEVMMKGRSDPTFPAYNTFSRFGSKRRLAARLLDYCKSVPGNDDITEMLAKSIVTITEVHSLSETHGSVAVEPGTKEGYVYLAMLAIEKAKRFKIGKTTLVERRKDQISIQLPVDLILIHSIATDDANGIELYWHRRFASKRTKGEWFSLSRSDIDAFKRRKFM